MDTSMPADSPSKRNSSNLYLVTFLATLFFLLFVSSAVVMRSFLLRRAYQHQIDHALAHGIVLTPRTPDSRKKRFGVRPRMYESWIAPLHVSGMSYGRWATMLPLNAQTVIVKRRTRDPNGVLTSPIHSPATTHSPQGSPAPAQGRLTALFSRQPSLPSLVSSPASASASSRLVQSGLLEFPHPNTRVDQQELMPTRERRESTNWRTIVSPSPSLASAAPRRLSMPASTLPGPTILDTTAHIRPMSAVVSPSSSGSRGMQDVSTTDPRDRSVGAMRSAWSLRPPGGNTTTTGASAAANSKYRIRTEMLQISVLVAMPDVRTSALYGDAGMAKRLRAAYVGGWGYRGPVLGASEKTERRPKEDEDEDEIVEVPEDELSSSDEDEEEEYGPLPELVLGVTRLNYRQGQPNTPTIEDRTPPTFVIPTSPPPLPPVPAPIPVPLAVYDSPLQPQSYHQDLSAPRPLD